MKLPAMKAISTSAEGVTAFRGYNHNLKIANYEFYDMLNITCERVPVMAARKRRARLRALDKANGLFAVDKLGWVDGTQLFYDGAVVGTVADSEKTMIRMGAYVLIWPDKVYYNTQDGVFGHLEANYTSAAGVTVSAALCRADGTPYDNYTVSDTAPEDAENGDYWLDISGERDYLKQYSIAMGMWTSVATVYTKISATGIGASFAEYDGVTIAGMDDEVLSGSFFLVACAANYIVVTAMLHSAITANSKSVTVSRTVPDMEYLTESNNRIWGCNSAKNEIYACALGDPKNWNQFMGLATDSYAVTVGSAGRFTGAVTHLGEVLFFKENMIHQILGTMPSNYTLSDTGARGVQAGSHKSLCVVNEILYYKGTDDVCAYGQSLPARISEPLGTVAYSEAVAGRCGRRYYLSMTDANGRLELLVYDTEAGIWCKEDNTAMRWCATIGTELYFIAGDTLWSVNGSLRYGDDAAQLEAKVPWRVETGELGLDNPYNKYISGIQLHMNLEAGTRVKVEIQYNGIGAWTEIYQTAAINPQSFTIPMSTKRCRTIKLRISGVGDFLLYSLVMKIVAGSDRYAT